MEIQRSLFGAGEVNLNEKAHKEIAFLVHQVFVKPEIDQDGIIKIKEKSTGKVINVYSADLLAQVENRNIESPMGDNYKKLKSVNDDLRRKMMTEISAMQNMPPQDLKLDKLVSLHNRMNKQIRLKDAGEEKMYFVVMSASIQKLILDKANHELDSVNKLGNFKHLALPLLTSVKEKLNCLEMENPGEQTFAAEVQGILRKIDKELPVESTVAEVNTSTKSAAIKSEKREPLFLDTYPGYHNQLSSAQIKEKFEGTAPGSWLMRLDSKGINYLVSYKDFNGKTVSTALKDAHLLDKLEELNLLEENMIKKS